jgi:hypothetical protein
MKKILRRKMVWNNVQFHPKRSNIWYRFYDKYMKMCPNSVIRKGNWNIGISYFTSDHNIKGWTVSIHRDDGSLVAWRDLMNDNYIRYKRIGLAENEALAWALSLKKVS